MSRLTVVCRLLKDTGGATEHSPSVAQLGEFLPGELKACCLGAVLASIFLSLCLSLYSGMSSLFRSSSFTFKCDVFVVVSRFLMTGIFS